MHPIQGSLHIGKAGLQRANEIGIRGNTEADTVHNAGKTQVRSREHVNIGVHSRHDVSELALAEIADGPPHASVNQRKELLSYVRVGAFGDSEVSYACVEGRIHAAVVQIVASSLNGRSAGAALAS